MIGAYSADEERHCMSLVLMPPYSSDEQRIQMFRTMCRNVSMTYAFSTHISLTEEMRVVFEQLHQELGADLRIACAAIFRAGLLGTYQEAIVDGMRRDTSVPMTFRDRLDEASPLALATILYVAGGHARQSLQG